MATVADILITEFKLKDNFSGAMQGIVSLAGRIGGYISTIGSGLANGLVDLVSSASRTAADLEALKMGLVAVAGSTAEAEAQMLRLKDVAKLPGLGFEEAIRGSVNLQAVGFSAEAAESTLMAFGNALATVGKGKDDLDGVILALTQMVSKGKVSAEEINQIAERVPQIRKAMQAAFGTADTEQLVDQVGAGQFIEGIVGELSKLPEVTGGAKNAFENFEDAVRSALGSIGEVANRTIVPAINTISGVLEQLVSGGVIERLATNFASLFGSSKFSADSLAASIFLIVRHLEEAPQRIRGFFDSFGDQVKGAKRVITGLATAIVFLGTIRVIGAVMNFIKVIGLIAAEIRKVGIATAFLQALGGPKGIAMVAVAGVTAVAAGFAINKAMGGDAPDMAETNEPLSLDEVVAKRAKRDYDRYKKGTKRKREPVKGSGKRYKWGTEEKKDGEPGKTEGAKKAGTPPPTGAEPDYARQTAQNTERLVRYERERAGLERHLIGGGGYSKMAVNDLGFSRAIGGTTKLDRIKRMLDEYMRELVAAEVGINNRRHGYSPVRQ